MEHHDGLQLSLGLFMTSFLVIGPNILAILSTYMARGRREGSKLALGGFSAYKLATAKA